MTLLGAMIPTSFAKIKLAFVPGIALSLFAGVHPMLLGLAVFQFLDFLTGVMASLATGHKLSSALASAGMKKKFMMWIYVLVAHLLATLTPRPEAVDYAAAAIAGLWICVEVISICENGAKLGLPPPPPLKWAIVRFKGIVEQSNGQISGVAEIRPQPPSGIVPPP